MKMLLASLIGVLFFAGIAKADSLKTDTSGFLQLFEQRFVQVNEETDRGVLLPHFPVTLSTDDDGETWNFLLNDEDILIEGIELFPEERSLSWHSSSQAGEIFYELVNEMEIFIYLTGDVELEFVIPVKQEGRRAAAVNRLAAAKKCRCQDVTGNADCGPNNDCDTAKDCSTTAGKHCKWFLDATVLD